MTPEEEFLSLDPPSHLDFQSPRPPSCENFQRAIRRGGVDFFWNNPIQLDYEAKICMSEIVNEIQWS